ncbi:MAG: hypothetical protein A3F43_05810 [Gammaproteobacteria bacterium RIFCSPHIGHO2_12_FULL_42_10]|nr:MAG: hypothetical protein A3F43_05810 [Gammaproteobacteria bacterium RIFCSPHIGHO2_12_FULL_42_10]
MSAIIVIPARFSSTRLPGKPLVLVKDKSLLYRVWSIAKAVHAVDQIYITTEDGRIADHAKQFGAKVIMTSATCNNGTERALAAVETLSDKPDIILNLQGDAVLTPPWVIQALLDEMLHQPSIMLGTIATQMKQQDYDSMCLSKLNGAIGGTTVVFDKKHNALYFSKNIIPFIRNRSEDSLPVYRHIGLYAYRYITLKQYVALAPTLLEQTEGLEQLRALENGIPIKVVVVDYQGRTPLAIDSDEDVIAAEKIINEEGELIAWN